MWPCALHLLLRALVALAILAAVQAEAPNLPSGDVFPSFPDLQPELQQQACEAASAEKLTAWCRGEPLPAGCFRVESVPEELPASCQLRGPRASAQATSLLGEGKSLVGGDVLLTGQLRLQALRFQLTGNLTLDDAQVVMLGNETAEEPESGGAFSAGGAVKLRESNLTVLGTKAHKDGGGFSAGDLMLFQSTLSIVGTAALSGGGGGFSTTGGVSMEHSSMRLQQTRAADRGGGFSAHRTVRLMDASLYILDSAADSGGGFFCGALELRASLMSVHGGRAESIGGAFWLTPIYEERSHVRMADSRVYIEECMARVIGGGFITRPTDEVRISGSVLKVFNVQAGQRSGGFDVGSLQVSSSVLQLENTTVYPGKVGAFHVWRRMVIGNHSNVTISRTSAEGSTGGFLAETSLDIADGSMLSIQQANALGPVGGFRALGPIRIAGGSALQISHSTARAGNGGGLWADHDVVVTGRSQLSISDSTSGRSGGGLEVKGSLRVMDQSTVSLKRCFAGSDGGGARIDRHVLVAGGSQFWVSDAVTLRYGGGFGSQSLQIVQGSRMDLQNVSAQSGGGFYTPGDVVVAHSSNLTVSESSAKLLNGGAFVAERMLRVTNGSRLEVANATAQKSAGAFAAETVSVSMKSQIAVLGGIAGKFGGCFFSRNLELVDSQLIASECLAKRYGGGFFAWRVSLLRSRLSVSGSAFQRGGGFFAKKKFDAWDSELGISSSIHSVVEPSADIVLGSGAFVEGPLHLTNSAFQLQNLRGKSAIEARCLRLAQSTLSLDAFTQVGIALQNAACTCGPATLQMQGALVGAGVSSALLFLDPCRNETLEIAHVHLTTAQTTLAEASTHTRLRNITVEYLQDVHDTQLLAAPSYEAEAVEVSCASCAHGVTFAPGTSSGLQVVSPPRLMCEQMAFLNRGTTARCRCSFPEQVPDPSYGHEVQVSETGSYCRYCRAHFEARDENCSKCPLYKAWSEGVGDPCATLPPQAEWWLPLLLAAVVFVLLGAAAFEVVWAPLAVVDAHTVEGEGLLMTVQGPICYLPKLLQRHIHRNVAFRFVGTGLSWLDGSERDFGSVKTLHRCKLQLPPTPEQPSYVCATSKGFLRISSGYGPMLLQFWMLLFLLLLVPAILAVAGLSGNYPQHVLGTAVLFALPLMVCVGFLHPVVAGLLRRQRTPLQEACREYLSELGPPSSATIPAEDQDHPSNQGLSIQALQHFWEHFRRFILDRTMHFVVANIVEPLTEKQQTSLVGLLQGKAVSHFVSHSWATPFQHFVQCLLRHAAFTGAVNPTYWICSFANNQWDIASEIGTDVLDSAFAKVLHSHLQGVVMVLDQQVQPLTRVWCLFEFLLASERQHNLVFATDLGVLGDQGASPDIALQVGRALRTLQVVNCHASVEEDRQKIFQFIRSKMGSLANMDIQIKQRMSRILQQNVQNLADATETLLLEMG